MQLIFPGFSYASSFTPSRKLCIRHNKNKSGAASVTNAIAYFLKFQYLTDIYTHIKRRSRSKQSSQSADASPNSEPYQKYLEDQPVPGKSEAVNINNNSIPKNEDNYCLYLENAIFGSPAVMQNVHMENLMVKRNNSGLISKLVSRDEDKKQSEDIIRHNLEKVQFYEQSQPCESLEDIFVS